MAPRSKKAFQKIRDEKTEVIERAALKCFMTHGYHSTSMSAIAKEAGTSTGLTYNYFESKEALLKAIFIKGMKRLFGANSDTYSIQSHEEFVLFLHDLFVEMKANVDYWKMYFTVMAMPEVASDFIDYMYEAATPLTNAVTEYFKSSGVEDPETETTFFFSMLDGICLNFVVYPDKYPLDAVAQRVMQQYHP